MPPATLNDGSYETFSKEIHQLASAQRIPLNASCEVTMRCNLRCQHCYIPLAQRRAARPDELRLDEFRRIFSEMADAGCLWLLLTGGEPLLRPDFLEIYDDAKSKGLILTLFTNATLLNDRIADHLAEYRPLKIEVSLYGATQKTYEGVTGIAGSYKRCLQGIELLQERGLPLEIKTPLMMTLNVHELAAMAAFSKQLGVNFYFDPVITAGIEGETSPTRLRLAAERIVEFERQDERRAKTWPESIASYEGQRLDVPNMYTCGAGRTSFHMDAFGRVSLCISARKPSYDLRHGSFREAWDVFFPGVIAMEYRPDFECLGCPLRMICAQCPAMGMTEMGDAETPVPFLCQLAHLRFDAFAK